ncbi:MAG: DUF262 domain-containing protein [Lachnospiraceae bacterium]|nr:DUF262 domain-containing protein [Lachnospiraceae bacterium]
MKISKALIQAVSFNPTEKSHKMTVLDMCKKIESREISLPLYQRDVSWTKGQAIELLNYQMLGKAPVAPISMNIILDIEDYVPQVAFDDREMIEKSKIEKGQMSVVDGQQRLTTNYKAYTNSDDFRNIVLDVARGRFLLEEGAFTKSQIPAGILLNKEDAIFYEYLTKNNMMKDTSFMTILVQCRSKIRSYYYTINQAENLTEDEQIEWFEVLNNAGSRVSALQMRFSKMKVHGIDIYTMYTLKFKNKLLEYGYDFFSPQKTSVSYPIAALNSAYEIIMNKPHTDAYAPIPSDTKENQLCALEPALLKQCFAKTLEALNKSVEFIQEQDVKEPDRIDYINYITGFFVYNPSPSNEVIKKVVDWYNKVDFNNKSNSRRRAIFTQLLNI